MEMVMRIHPYNKDSLIFMTLTHICIKYFVIFIYLEERFIG